VACGGDVLDMRRVLGAALQHSYGTPGFVLVETIQGVARDDTGLATRAAIQIDFETVLFVRLRRVERDEFAVEAGLGCASVRVCAGESIDGRPRGRELLNAARGARRRGVQSEGGAGAHGAHASDGSAA